MRLFARIAFIVSALCGIAISPICGMLLTRDDLPSIALSLAALLACIAIAGLAALYLDRTASRARIAARVSAHTLRAARVARYAVLIACAACPAYARGSGHAPSGHTATHALAGHSATHSTLFHAPSLPRGKR